MRLGETQGPSPPLRSGRDAGSNAAVGMTRFVAPVLMARFMGQIIGTALVALEAGHERFQFRRERSFAGEKLFRAGMVEFQGSCMQEVSG